MLFQCHEELPLEACLPVDTVLQVPVVGVVVGGAGATPVRTICLKHGEVDLLHPGEEDVGDLIFPEERKRWGGGGGGGGGGTRGRYHKGVCLVTKNSWVKLYFI